MNTAVGLVETYLRLNGYFTVTEFQVQHPVPGQPGKFETATDLHNGCSLPLGRRPR